MKKLLKLSMAFLLTLYIGLSAHADEYSIRVDGVSCPFCAYGIEKKLKAIEGVEAIDIDLKKGLVIINVRDGIHLQEADMQKLFSDAGFTYRTMQVTTK